MFHVPVKSMVYKTFVGFNNQNLQQSWIAEMKTAMPDFCDEIDRLNAEWQIKRVELSQKRKSKKVVLKHK